MGREYYKFERRSTADLAIDDLTELNDIDIHDPNLSPEELARRILGQSENELVFYLFL